MSKVKEKSYLIPNNVKQESICQALTQVNDIIRLCIHLAPSADPIRRLTTYPRIIVPFNQSWNISQAKLDGKLVIIDTPGPNAAVEHRHMKQVVIEQLQRCSLILLILDFTQLNNDAAEKVKREVQKIIKIKGRDSLYVVVNKIDQRNPDEDLTQEQVRQFVSTNIGLSEISSDERVFEISALKAYKASNFLQEVQFYSNAQLPKMSWANELVEATHGSRGKERLIRGKLSKDELIEDAKFLWNESGFSKFLEKVVRALIFRAAPESISSALRMALKCLEQQMSNSKLKSKAIDEETPKLIAEINSLKEALSSVDKFRRNPSTDIRQIKYGLCQTIKKKINAIESNCSVSPNVIFSRVKDFGSIKDNETLVFTNQKNADAFKDEIADYNKEIVEDFLETCNIEIEKLLVKSHTRLVRLIRGRVEPIIEQAQNRIDSAFNIRLPRLHWQQLEKHVAISNIGLQENTVYESPGYTDDIVSEPVVVTKHRHAIKPIIDLPVLRHIFRREVIESYQDVEYRQRIVKRQLPKQKMTTYVATINNISTEINRSVSRNAIHLFRHTVKCLDEDFKNAVNRFFRRLNGYLCNYQNVLEEALKDQNESIERKEQLKNELASSIRRMEDLKSQIINLLQTTLSYSLKDAFKEKEYDVFISHASEDKEDLALPLAVALRNKGLRVWIDENRLKVGDSVRRSIEDGLLNSRYGIVILSPNFSQKEWAQKELDALASLENEDRKILFIWHNIDFDGVKQNFPLFASRYAVSSRIGIKDVVAQLLQAINQS